MGKVASQIEKFSNAQLVVREIALTKMFFTMFGDI